VRLEERNIFAYFYCEFDSEKHGVDQISEKVSLFDPFINGQFWRMSQFSSEVAIKQAEIQHL